MADALVIAGFGGQALWNQTQGAYMETVKRPYMKVMESVVNHTLPDLITSRPLAQWKETLALFCTHAQPGEWATLCDQLALALDQSGDASSASLCYICSGNMEKTVQIWLRNFPEADGTHAAALALQDVMEKAVVLGLVGGGRNLPSSLAALVAKYSDLLASQGLLGTAFDYLTMLPEATQEEGLRVLKDRIYRSGQIPVHNIAPPPFPFDPEPIPQSNAPPAPISAPSKPSPYNAPPPSAYPPSQNRYNPAPPVYAPATSVPTPYSPSPPAYIPSPYVPALPQPTPPQSTYPPPDNRYQPAAPTPYQPAAVVQRQPIPQFKPLQMAPPTRSAGPTRAPPTAFVPQPAPPIPNLDQYQQPAQPTNAPPTYRAGPTAPPPGVSAYYPRGPPVSLHSSSPLAPFLPPQPHPPPVQMGAPPQAPPPGFTPSMPSFSPPGALAGGARGTPSFTPSVPVFAPTLPAGPTRTPSEPTPPPPPAPAPPPAPTVNSVDTSNVPADLRPVVATLKALYKESGEAAGGDAAPLPKKREVEDSNRKIGALLASLVAGEVSPHTTERLQQLCAAVEAKDYARALHLQVEMTTTDWDEGSAWLVPLKRMIRSKQTGR